MKKRYPIIASLIIFCAGIYIHLEVVGRSDAGRKNDSAKISQQLTSRTGVSQTRRVDPPAADLAYAIVMMPKSYLPALKRFARSPMARDLKILPARIEWKDEQLIAFPKKPVSGAENRQKSMAEPVSLEAGTTGPAPSRNFLKNAAFLLMLQGVVHGQSSSPRGRSPSPAYSP